MDTLALWRYSHPCDGCVTTKDRFTEAEALRIFPDAERVEGSEVVVEHFGHIGWSFTSNLLRREDGVIVQRSAG